MRPAGPGARAARRSFAGGADSDHIADRGGRFARQPAAAASRYPPRRAKLASRRAAIGVAEADLYPRFVLFGFLGYFSNYFAWFFAEKSFTGFVAPTFNGIS